MQGNTIQFSSIHKQKRKWKKYQNNILSNLLHYLQMHVNDEILLFLLHVLVNLIYVLHVLIKIYLHHVNVYIYLFLIFFFFNIIWMNYNRFIDFTNYICFKSIDLWCTLCLITKNLSNEDCIVDCLAVKFKEKKDCCIFRLHVFFVPISTHEKYMNEKHITRKLRARKTYVLRYMIQIICISITHLS